MMAVIHVGIDDDGLADSEGLHRMQPGDLVLLTARGEYSSVSGEYLAVNNNGKCQGVRSGRPNRPAMRSVLR